MQPMGPFSTAQTMTAPSQTMQSGEETLRLCLTPAFDGVITEPKSTGIRTHTRGQTSYNSHDTTRITPVYENPAMETIYMDSHHSATRV
jgi:hypothetical protein